MYVSFPNSLTKRADFFKGNVKCKTFTLKEWVIDPFILIFLADLFWARFDHSNLNQM